MRAEERCHGWTEARTGDVTDRQMEARAAPERSWSQVQFAFSLSTLKPQGGRWAGKWDITEAYMAVRRLLRATAHFSAIPPGHSVPGSKWSHTWQTGRTSRALRILLNTSVNQGLVIGLSTYPTSEAGSGSQNIKYDCLIHDLQNINNKRKQVGFGGSHCNPSIQEAEAGPGAKRVLNYRASPETKKMKQKIWEARPQVCKWDQHYPPSSPHLYPPYPPLLSFKVFIFP